MTYSAVNPAAPASFWVEIRPNIETFYHDLFNHSLRLSLSATLKNLSPEEMKSAAAFYKSPASRKVVVAAATMMQNMPLIIQQETKIWDQKLKDTIHQLAVKDGYAR